MKGFTKQRTYSIQALTVQTLIAAIITSSLLVFSAGALSADKESADKPAHAKAAPITSIININKADAQTLAQLHGVGEKKAQAIIAYRESNGGFKSVDDLLNVKGIGKKTLERNRALISIN